MKRRAFFSRVALVICLFAVYPAFANAVEVSGEITTTTWTAANSPYRVTGTVTVPTGSSSGAMTVRATASANTRNAAPPTRLAGSRIR